MKTRGKKVTMFILTLVLAMGMVGSSVFAAPGDGSVNKAPGTDHGTTDTNRMNAYKEINVNQPDNTGAATNPTYAKMHLTKEHTATNFRGIKSFEFEITKVKAWHNDHTSTALNGKDASALPDIVKTGDLAPVKDGNTDNATITDITNGWKVVLEDYSKKKDRDTDEARKRGVILNFGEFEKAGYYVYHVREIAGTEDGVTYDKDEYDIVVYVANKVDENDNTTEGVYVHSITRWRNAAANDVINDIKNLNAGSDYDATKDMGTNTDADGQAAKDESPYDKDSTKGKEEITDKDKPNEIPVHFDNKEPAQNLKVSKNVTGTLGDLTKNFKFKLTMTVSAGSYPIVKNGAENLLVAEGSSTGVEISQDGTKLIVPESTSATSTVVLTFTLKDDENLEIKNLPIGTKYTVVETASDHQASFKVKIDGTEVSKADAQKWLNDKGAEAVYVKDGYAAPLTQAVIDAMNDTDKIKVAKVKNSAAINDGKNAPRATGEEVIDSVDGAAEVAYTNHRDIETETGIPFFAWPIAGAGILALIALAVIRRRKNVATVNDFEF